MTRAIVGISLLLLSILACQVSPELVGTGATPGAAGAGAGDNSRPPGAGGAHSGGGSPGAGESGALPCDVASVLHSKCQSCHGATPLYGAPMPLMSYDDTQASAHSDPSQEVWQVMQTRIHSSKSPMPPAGQTPLAATEMATLDAWLSAGAHAGVGKCTAGGGGAGGGVGTGGTGGAGDAGVTDPNAGIGPKFLPCTPTHTLTTHAAGSTTAKYLVPNPTNDLYTCFTFKSPFAPGEQAIATAPIIDDSRVIHHFILYGVTTGTDGAITTGTGCQATTLTGTHVTGWAPGGQNAVMDPDVGLVLDYPYFTMQVHYNNQRYSDGADASGVAFCSTTTPRQNAAGIVTLGPMLFSIPANANNYPVNSSCPNLASDGTTTMTVIGTSPHMHLLGTGFRTQHMRGTTSMGDLINLPLGTWSFENQKHYLLSPRRQVRPGDTLQSTCYYDNPSGAAVNFGTRTTDEMCFNFITAYPYAAATRKCAALF